FVEVGMTFLERRALRRDVPVVERVKRGSQLLEKLEGHLGLALGVGHRVAAIVPGTVCRTHSERIGQCVAKRVPVDDREPEMLLHRLATDDFAGIVMLELQGVTRLGTPKIDLRHIRKKRGHRLVSPLATNGQSARPSSLLIYW